MSDRETILETLKRAESRIRANQVLGRIATALSIWVGLALLVKAWDLLAPLTPFLIRGFWLVWFAGLAVLVVRSLKIPRDLARTAAAVDKRAHLKEEVLSAYWFLSQGTRTPWVELQVHRAAGTAAKLDLARLYPRVIPPTSYIAAVGLVLLLTLNFVPLPFVDNLVFSEPTPPPLTEAEGLLEEIEELLVEADALRPDGVIEEFQTLRDSVENLELEETDDLISRLQSLLDEGNLTTSEILEGLAEMGSDLETSEDTSETGAALAEGAVEEAAEALEQLAAELGAGQAADEDLQQALEQASQNPQTGLEELAGQFAEAAEGLEGQSPQATEQSLAEAANSLEQLSDLIQSQQLRNEAAARMEELRETLEQLNEQLQSEELSADSNQAPGDAVPQEGSPELEQGAEGSAEGQLEPAEAGDLPAATTVAVMQEVAGGSDAAPLGLGISPDEKEGAPTSLEVQLVEEILEAEAIGEADGDDPLEQTEEASRQEQSSLDYRNVPSELTPAQQDLLNQDRIPREYQNLIKEYFQAIRPQPQP